MVSEAIGRYRSATERDVDDIAALVEVCYRSEESARTWTSEYHLVTGERSSPAEVARSVTGPGSLMLVGEVAGEIASCCRLVAITRERVQLGLLCVHPALQSRGLGSELLEAAARTAREHFGARTLSLQVLSPRIELRAWYERIGFHETGERVALSEEIEPALALVRDLEFVVYERDLENPRPPT